MAQPSRNNENINNIIRGLSLLGIVWVVNTTNVTATNLLLLKNDVGHVKTKQVELKRELLDKMSDRFTGDDGEKLEAELKELEVEFYNHEKNKGAH